MAKSELIVIMPITVSWGEYYASYEVSIMWIFDSKSFAIMPVTVQALDFTRAPPRPPDGVHPSKEGNFKHGTRRGFIPLRGGVPEGRGGVLVNAHR